MNIIHIFFYAHCCLHVYKSRVGSLLQIFLQLYIIIGQRLAIKLHLLWNIGKISKKSFLANKGKEEENIAWKKCSEAVATMAWWKTDSQEEKWQALLLFVNCQKILYLLLLKCFVLHKVLNKTFLNGNWKTIKFWRNFNTKRK